MTVCWHMNDLKVSHVDPKEITKFGDWLSKMLECLRPSIKKKCTII